MMKVDVPGFWIYLDSILTRGVSLRHAQNFYANSQRTIGLRSIGTVRGSEWVRHITHPLPRTVPRRVRPEHRLKMRFPKFCGKPCGKTSGRDNRSPDFSHLYSLPKS